MKWLEGLSWITIIAAAVIFILGLVGGILSCSLLVSPRGCTLIASALLLFALNFSLLRSLKLREQG